MRLGLIGSALAAMALAGATAAADRETAQFLAQRADKALQAKTWGEAEQLYRKALDEDSSFLPARYGLAEALLGGGQRAPGLEELRRFRNEAGQASTLPAAWTALLSKARKRLDEIDSAGGELDRLLDDHVASLMAFATRWREKDPQAAGQAVDTVLRLRPGHEKAAEIRDTIERAAGKAKVLFNGKDITGWTGMGVDVWRVEDGLLEGVAKDFAILPRTEVKLTGSFDVLVEARIADPGSVPFFALVVMQAEYDKTLYGMMREDLVVWEYSGTKEYRAVHEIWKDNLKPPLDGSKFNVYELRFREKTIEAFLNGTSVRSYSRPPERGGGFVALQLQHCKVVIKRVEAIQR